MRQETARLCLLALLAAAASAQTRSVVIDTDAGSDDLMAIAFLLARPDVRIEAITVVNGLAHVNAGAQNVARVLQLAGRRDVPVFAGRSQPSQGRAEFPAEWRRIADQLPGVDLPAATRAVESRPAADYLAERLRQRSRPFRILALGPLTNIAEALARAPANASTVEEIVIMGGAIRVPGNLRDGGLLQTSNTTAEWNMFIDPMAARIVFRAGMKIRLIALDATNTVRIGPEFLHDFESHAQSKLARMVRQVLESDRQTIDQGYFYAWDPLAAAALVTPRLVRTAPMHIDIGGDSPEAGRTVHSSGPPNAEVAFEADAAEFRRVFFNAFESAAAPKR